LSYDAFSLYYFFACRLILKKPMISKITSGLFRLFLVSLIVTSSHRTFSQEETPKKVYHFNGNVSVTNNGFSFVPTFSLGEPATIAELSIGGKRFSFEPQFRFELKGLKPWSFIAIWRYDLIQNEKTRLRLGVHFPAFSYLKKMVEIDGVMTEIVFTQRWITPELIFSQKLSEKVNVGAYYIHGFGLEPEGQVHNTNFLSLRMGLNIPFAKKWYFRWNPEVYYLTMDDLGGFFAAQNLALGHQKVPVYLASTMNVSLEKDNEIPAKDFNWNISIVYTFKLEFTRR